MRERSENLELPHASYLNGCVKEGLPVPTDLQINILDHKIQEDARQGRWTLVCGFPANVDSLVEFERKVRLVLPPSERCLPESLGYRFIRRTTRYGC